MLTRTILVLALSLFAVQTVGCSNETGTSNFRLTATANALYNATSAGSGNSSKYKPAVRHNVATVYANMTATGVPPTTMRPATPKPIPTGAGGTSSGIPAPPTPALVPTPQPTMTPTQYLIGLATFFRSNWILDSDHAVRVSSHLESLNPPREYLQDHKRLLDVHQLWLYQFMQVEFFDESSALTYGAMSDAVVSCANATDPYAHVDYTIEYKTACNQLSKLRSFVWDEEWFWKDNDAYKQVEEYAQIIR